MTQDDNLKERPSELRARAEELLRQTVTDREDLSGVLPDDVRKLVHELQVHQIELEMQNDELHHAQLALEESRDRYLDLYEYAPVGYFTLDKNAIVLEANLSAVGLLGIERGSLVGKPLTKFVHKESQDTFYFHSNRVLQSGTRHVCEIKLLKRDGSWFYAQLESVGMANLDGQVSRLRTVVADITDRMFAADAVRRAHDELELRVEERTSELREKYQELEHEIEARKNAEAELSESRQRLDLALRGAGLGSWSWDLRTQEAFFDQRWTEMLGYFVEEIEPHVGGWERLIRGEDKPRVMKLLHEHLEDRTPLFEAEYRLRAKSGEWRWILTRGRVVERDGDGKPLRVAGTNLNVTDRRQAEQALRLSEERFRALVEGAQDLIFMKDRHLTYTHANPAMARMFGLDVSEIIGRKDEDLYGEATGKHIKQVDLRVLGGETIEEEYTASIKGTKVSLSTVLTPLRDVEGNIVGVYGISRDITERKRTVPGRRRIPEAYPSEAMQTALHEARLAAATDSIVLLQGESGSGKDYLARWIHDHSKRAPGPYFAVNCAAIPGDLAESELFGHERGSFTGAHGKKRGLLELAEGGTLLLNEIGELSLPLQSKLLTFLDTRSFLRVGGEKGVTVNARIIAATNRRLETEVVERRFLSPLLYRLNVFAIWVPPLRDRTEDIPVLVDELMSQLAHDLQLTSLPTITPAALSALSGYTWPGNVRELRNVLERSLMLSHGNNLNLVLPSFDAGQQEDWSHVSNFPEPERTLHDVTDEVIKSLCLEALRRCEGNKRCAARMLGIARDSLYRHLKRFGIENYQWTKDKED
ncbi:MAG: sigma 54-interacting transcriptional regulator [Desulfomonilaceae bacterium]|nr:sigma 54-interacting transcriptional regulator [Desulfomonilaceae bacterium]